MGRAPKAIKRSPEQKLQSLEGEVAQVYDWAKRELDEVEAQLTEITARRDELLRMLEWAQGFPQVSVRNAPRRRTLQWSRIEHVMMGRGALDTATIIRLLVEDGVDLPKDARQVVASALHRAFEAHKLKRVSRGQYELVEGVATVHRSPAEDQRWEAVHSALQERGELSAKEMLGMIRGTGDEGSEQRLRALLGRWVKQGLLRNSRHGRYVLA
ncbi:MAG: hypothetical protein RBU37_28305 [Myxococcota bacterium]|jgi:hypothetical protein|nr:hypothetical protein [Myxococcota bacterium]